MTDTVKLQVRLPGTVHARTVNAKERDNRSLNGEIVTLITEALDSREERERLRVSMSKNPLSRAEIKV